MSETPDIPSPPPAAGYDASPSKGWQPPTAAELQTMLPQYEITGLLGRGGMGAVYRGTQKSLNRQVAVKILPPGLADDSGDASYVERFKNEALVMARLSHPDIVTVYASGETAGGLLYIVMEFVEGTDVSRVIARQGCLPPKHALAIATQLCEALHYAHERGIIHRDIKPANIMLGNHGRVKVADFGLAKICNTGETGLTRSGMAMGTLHYMAPEALILGVKVDHRADLYAAGVMLYHMLTGRLPQGLFEPPSQQIPGLDPRFDAIITRALHDDREARYQSAAEMKRDLELLLTRPAPVAQAEANTPAMVPNVPTDEPPLISAGEKHRPMLLWAAVLVFSSAIALLLLWQRPVPVANTPKATTASTPPAAPATTSVNVPPPAVTPPASPPVVAASAPPLPPPAAAKVAASAPKAPATAKPVDLRTATSFTNTLGMKFVRLPGTEVFMCVHETRMKDYTAFAAAGFKNHLTYNGLPVSFTPDHPVVMVNWQQAKDFCVWLGNKEGRRYRLPTEREWNIAASIGSLDDQATTMRPWGDALMLPDGIGNFADSALKAKLDNSRVIPGFTDGHATTAPVMSFRPNKHGLYDLNGNVWELCEDLFEAGNGDQVACGGSWRVATATGVRQRQPQHPAASMYDVGFRCVVDASSTTGPPAVVVTLPVTPKAAAKYEVLTPRLKQIPFPATSDAAAMEIYAKALLDYRNGGMDRYVENDRRHLLGETAQVNFEAVLRAIASCENRSTLQSHDAILQIVRKHANAQNQAAILRAFELHYALSPVIEEKKWLPSAAPALAAAVSHYSYLTGSTPAESSFFRLCFQSESNLVWANLELLFRKPEFEAAANAFEGGLKDLPADIQKSQTPRLQRLAATMLDAATKTPVSNAYRPYRLLNTAIAATRVGNRNALEQLSVFLTEGKPPVSKEHLTSVRIRVMDVLRDVTSVSRSYSFLDTGKWLKYRLHSLRWDETNNQFVSK